MESGGRCTSANRIEVPLPTDREQTFGESVRERQRLRAALDHTLGQLEHASEVVGKEVPAWVDAWAERNGLDVTRSEFAPAGQIFIVGTIAVTEPRW